MKAHGKKMMQPFKLYKSIAECDEKLCKVMAESNIEILMNDYEKNNEITTLKISGTHNQLKKIINTDSLFNMKRKASAKHLADVNKCNGPSCDSINRSYKMQQQQQLVNPAIMYKSLN